MKRFLLALPFVLAACDRVPTEPRQATLSAARPSFAFSSAPCTFTTSGSTMQLDADCSTSTSIVIPDGFTLDGAHHTITAVDPLGDHFRSGVVRNGGASASVVFLEITVSSLADVCDAGTDRLRGILFDGAAGSISHSSVTGLNQGASGCQEGNAIEVRNFGPNPQTSVVEIAHNSVTDYQKTGIVCNGNSKCDIHHNAVGASATQANLAANSVQIAFGATGVVSTNNIEGNSWCAAGTVATAVLLFDPGPGLVVESNQIGGNSDVGIYAQSDGATISKNKVADESADCSGQPEDIGIGDFGSSYPDASNSLTKNQVSGFVTPYDPASPGGKNKVKKPHGSPS